MYARVSSPSQRKDLATQKEALRAYCLEAFCERHGTDMSVMNGEVFSPEEELVRDLIAVVTVFSARLHGLRSHTNAIRAAALGKEGSDDQSTQNPPASYS